MVGIGKHVLKIDTTKFGKAGVFSADEPLRCPVDRLVDGVQLVGTHDGEVTDLSMCQWMTTRLVSASVDGTVRGSFAYSLLCLLSLLYVAAISFNAYEFVKRYFSNKSYQNFLSSDLYATVHRFS